MTLVLSFLRSKVRNAGIEIYHITSSEKFQGHWKWLQRRSSLYKWFRFEKRKWPESEGGNAVGTKTLHPKDWHIFNNIPTIWNPPVLVPFIAANWQIEVSECLLSLGAECFVLLFVFPPIIKDQITQNCSFCCWFVPEKNWSLIFRLSTFEDLVFRCMFGSKRKSLKWVVLQV